MKIVTKPLKNLRLFKLVPFLLLLFAIAGTTKLHAQQQNLPSRFLTVKDGLPQGFVSGIVQDKAGFIWVSTRNGLARYDGKKFKVFYHDLKDTTTIAGNIITNIFLDSKNRLWIKYENDGFDIFYPEMEKIQHLSNLTGLKALREIVIEANGIYEDSDGGILLNTFNHGIIKLNIDGKFTLQYPLRKIIQKTEDISGVFQTGDFQLFILKERFLYHFNEKQQLVNKVPLNVPSSIIKSGQGRYKMFFSMDSILFVSGLNGAIKYRAKNNNYTLVSGLPPIKRLEGFNKYSVSYFNNDEATFAFSHSGHSYTFNSNAEVNITYLLDRKNILWIGTAGYGLQLINLVHNSFQYQKYTPPLTGFVIKNYFKTAPYKIPKLFTDDDNDLRYSSRFAYDKNGKLWMSNLSGKANRGLQLYTYTNNHFTKPEWHYSNGEKIKEVKIYGIAADSRNFIWLLSNGYNIHKLNQVNGTVQSFSPALPVNISESDLSLYIDKQDNFWITCNAGLLYYKEGLTGFTLYSIRNKNIPDINLNRIINIAEDLHNENNLWMGSIGNGLICFNKKEKKFTAYTKNDGLPDNTIYSVMADDNGFIWCSTNQGIFRFDTQTKKARKYSSEDGAPDFEFNRFHHLRLPDGRFAFGGFEDYTVFDPLSLTDDTSNLNVAITGWKINNQPAEYREQGSPLSQSVNSLKEVHLNHLQNFLTFEVAALQYNQPEIFEYRYKLSGIDKDWVYSGTNNSINYTALAPGKYTLHINAANASGLWSNKVKELTIIIHPPWWQTWWFYSITVMAAFSLIYTVYRYRLNQVVKLERVRNRIARDLHDEIGSSLSAISIYTKVVQQQLKGTSGTTLPLLTKITDNANQVQEAISDIVWSINTKNDELESIINRMREHAIQLFEAKDYLLHFNFDHTLNNVKLNMEQRKDFYLIYKEALNNIAKYAEGSNVWISFTANHNYITLLIKDDGKGFNVNGQSKSGNGLHNMQARSQALKGNIQIISEKGNGTTVRLNIPK